MTEERGLYIHLRTDRPSAAESGRDRLAHEANIAAARDRIGHYMAKVAIEHELDDCEMMQIIIDELADWSKFRG